MSPSLSSGTAEAKSPDCFKRPRVRITSHCASRMQLFIVFAVNLAWYLESSPSIRLTWQSHSVSTDVASAHFILTLQWNMCC